MKTVCACALLMVGVGLTFTAPVRAAHQFELRADARDKGYIGLALHWRPGASVTVAEQTATGSRPVRTMTLTADDERLPQVATWRCDRRVRRFVATSTTEAGAPVSAAAEVRTPSCARRVSITVQPRRVRPGRRVSVRLVDRWHLDDLRPAVCTSPPGGPRACRRMRTGRRTKFRARSAGIWIVRVRTPWQEISRRVGSRHRGGRLTLLATGDSMIQIIDSFLDQRLRGRAVRVHSDAHISTGISKPGMLDWEALAGRQARTTKPDVTIVFLGANDGFPMGGLGCCGSGWVAEYARRVRRMMRSYERNGAGRVYWGLLPVPRGGIFRETFPAVNAAIRRAAARERRGVRVIDFARIFTPGGRYRETMQIQGRPTRVRQADGVHLSTAGASLAASVLVRTLRAERILR